MIQTGFGLSLSARRAWIEIASGTLSDTSDVVALRKESVDRNRKRGRRAQGIGNVALRKESVDRNQEKQGICFQLVRSLSARRAWIEIVKSISPMYLTLVALRKESVDRNKGFEWVCLDPHQSLSARRAWIEIDHPLVTMIYALRSLSARRAWIEIRRASGAADIDNVALRKESVDRNMHKHCLCCIQPASLSARRAWIEILS